MDIPTELSVPTEPWEAAKARFLEELSDQEKYHFKEAKTDNLSIEHIFYSASAAHALYKNDSKLAAASKKLRPLVETLEDFSKAMDVFANTSPLFICPIWGSVRVVLQVFIFRLSTQVMETDGESRSRKASRNTSTRL
jgi:hypothetical protein